MRHKGSVKEVKAKVLCGAADARSIFREFHTSEIGEHCGQIKTRDAISLRCYWPSMTSDIEKWVRWFFHISICNFTFKSVDYCAPEI